MQISIIEFRENTDKYLDLAQQQEIIIEKNGNDFARISGVNLKKREAIKEFKKLKGILPEDTDIDSLRMERILK